MRSPIVRRRFILSAIVFALAALGRSSPAAGAERRPVAAIADDLDADVACPGCPDLAIADAGQRAVSVRFGNGDGTFGTPVDLALTGAAFAVALGDCDGDGDIDVFAVSAGGNLAVFLNQQQQASPQTFLEASGSPMKLGGKITSLLARAADGAPLDLDADGALDLAAVSRGKTVITLHGDGLCGFDAPEAAPYAGKRIVALAAGDFDDADGTDVVLADRFGSRAVTLFNDGSGALGAPSESYLGGGPTSLLAADLDGNGVPDAVATHAKNQVSADIFGVNVLHGNAGLGLSAANQYGSGGRGPVASTVGDFDGVAPVDIVALNRKDASLGFLAGLGAAAFAAPVASPLGAESPLGLTSGDFDGDGNLDVVVVVRSASTLLLCPGDGAGSFNCTPIAP